MRPGMHRRLLWGIPGVALLVLATLVAVAMTSQAAVTGPCTGTINGQDIHGRVVVPENGTVAWNFESTAGFVKSWAVALIFLSNSISVDVGEDEEPDKTSKGGVANVNDYAEYGVGVYHLIGAVETEGGTCQGSVEIVVQGNPLTTVVGGVAAGVAVLGVGGGAAASVGAAKAALLGLKP